MPKVKIAGRWYKVNALEQETKDLFGDHGGLVGIEIKITGLVVEGGEIVKYPLGKMSAAPRVFTPGSRGFHASGKVADPSDAGMKAGGSSLQVGANLVYIGSSRWGK